MLIKSKLCSEVENSWNDFGMNILIYFRIKADTLILLFPFFSFSFLSHSVSSLSSPHPLLDYKKIRVSIVLHYKAAHSVHSSLYRSMCGSTTEMEAIQFSKNYKVDSDDADDSQIVPH